MSDTDLAALAEAAGIAPRWKSVYGHWHDVAPPTMRVVLRALGLPADTAAEVADSRAHVGDKQGLPPLATAQAGGRVTVPGAPKDVRVVLESGEGLEVHAEAAEGGAAFTAPDIPGYHLLRLGDREITLAVAPGRCFSVHDAAPSLRPWGLAVQLYALRRPGDAGLGDFGALQAFVRAAGRRGASAVAISPVHAQFSADPDRFSPYSPSSRMLLNVLHAEMPLPDDEEARRLASDELVDWPAAARLRLRALRRAFETADADTLAAFEAFRAGQGDVLETHARFEALHAHHFGADPARWHWRGWPEEHRDPRSPAVAAFAREHAREVSLHAFMQFLADRSLAGAQRAAREAGMPIGLVADLAVGADSGGSHCWSRQEETLIGLTVGAPPDLLAPKGQNWGLAAFSPRGLVKNGFGAYLEMLRAAMRHAGGVRIDHAMGLARLWVVPEGAESSEGAYLHFPLQDMLRLIALESSRHRAIVLGEDLGTVPEGFQDALQAAAVLGMRVLWFERNEHGFTPPRTWTRGASAMTSTHDLATVAGWWTGRDLEWRGRLDLMGDEANVRREHDERTRDRGLLWSAFRESGAAHADPPAPDQPTPAVDAAVRHMGTAACELVMLPVEDALGTVEQPNLPGTLDEHPNWRRRLPGYADDLLNRPDVIGRLDALNEARTPR